MWHAHAQAYMAQRSIDGWLVHDPDLVSSRAQPAVKVMPSRLSGNLCTGTFIHLS